MNIDIDCCGDKVINTEHIEMNIEKTEEAMSNVSLEHKGSDSEERLKNFNVTYSNPQYATEYIDEIFVYLKELEKASPHYYPAPEYMKNQYDINEKMRSILLDWLVEVHLKFKLLEETLYLTINLIDRYLSKKSIHRSNLQLVGVTSMLIACKYEEIYAPEVRDFVYITDKAYNKEDIIKLENEMLGLLKYEVTVPSGLRFIEIYNNYLKFDEILYLYINYLMELCLVDYKALQISPSLLATSCAYVAIKLFQKDNIKLTNEITSIEDLLEISGFCEDDIRDAAKIVCLIYDNIEKNANSSIKKKYCLPKFKEIAKIKFT